MLGGRVILRGRVLLNASERVFHQRQLLRSMSTTRGPVQSSIESKLQEAFKPAHLAVMNESYMHNVPKGSETHFKVVVVADGFKGLTPVQRHQKVFGLLEEEIKVKGVHALSITAKTPEQWAKQNNVEPSPKCMGGSKR